MLVSVCLPIFNGGEFLESALASVLQQTYRDLEILISDDGSDDGSFELAQELAEQDDRLVVWRNDSRLGLFPNYNECLARARGELIKPFAQDDLLRPDAIEKMAAALERHSAAIVGAAKESLDAGPYVVDEQAETLPSGKYEGKDVIRRSLKAYRNLVGEPVAVLFDAKHIGKGFNDNYFSLGDLEYWFRILERGSLYYLAEPLVTFRQHPGSATSKMLEDMTWILDFFRLGKEYKTYLDDQGISEQDYIDGFIDLAGNLIDRLVVESNLSIRSLSGFKEVAFFAMRRAANLAAKGREYDSVVSSTSWRITEPLRNLKTKIDKKKSE